MSAARFDLIVIGAGSAGAAAAAFAAEAGLRVALLERRQLASAGAAWVNGVAHSQFDAAGVARPAGAENRGQNHRFHLIAGWGLARVSAQPRGVCEVDMRLLIDRLQQRASDAGVTVWENADVTAHGDSTLQTSRGAVTAPFVLDASGLAGVNLLRNPQPVRADLCVAAQYVFALADHGAAAAFFARHGATMGDVVCFTGVSGGYSIVNVRAHVDEVSILAGSTPEGTNRSGQQLIDQFTADNPWIGPRKFGGARAIPLARQRLTLATARIAAVGDAAGQVYSPHGSGVGLGLIAARMAVDALIERRDLRSYAHKWHARYGVSLASHDVFRRYSARLEASDLAALIDAGVLDGESLCAGLEQRLPALSPTDALQKIAAVASLGTRAAPLLSALATMGWVRAQGGLTAAAARYGRS